MIKKFLFEIILLAGLGSISEPAYSAEALTLGPIKVAELEQIYDYYDYKGERGYLMIPGYHYPPIYLQTFPEDFNAITDEKHRNGLFIKILAPLAMKINQEILAEREQIKKISAEFEKNQDLTPEQSQVIERFANRYDIFTRMQGYPRNQKLIKELLMRVDALPPSFYIAVAAIATDWGSSRLLKEGNALYKRRVWNTQEGLKPLDETEDDSYRYKTYPTLYSAMKDFALRLNSDVAFGTMRTFRRDLRFRDSVLRGTTFAHTLLWNSPLSNYAGMLEYTIAYYELNIIDKSLLNSKMIDKELPKDLKKFLQKDNP